MVVTIDSGWFVPEGHPEAGVTSESDHATKYPCLRVKLCKILSFSS